MIKYGNNKNEICALDKIHIILDNKHKIYPRLFFLTSMMAIVFIPSIIGRNEEGYG